MSSPTRWFLETGELYRVSRPTPRDPKRSRVFVIVSRQVLLQSRFSTVICAPVYSVHDGLSTQVPVGTEEGLKHDSSIHCDELISLPKSVLTDYVGVLPPLKLHDLNRALAVALEIGAEAGGPLE
ncbi:MAG TPA: type II toxin-antitoxin system PemK/MazF family toxin [Thermoanaerobaculia bacterium]|nr:type II toxin-antitoxin system PemK/MazF family toxin [Thermoanaerobaculia bacterium]